MGLKPNTRQIGTLALVKQDMLGHMPELRRDDCVRIIAVKPSDNGKVLYKITKTNREHDFKWVSASVLMSLKKKK